MKWFSSGEEYEELAIGKFRWLIKHGDKNNWKISKVGKFSKHSLFILLFLLSNHCQSGLIWKEPKKKLKKIKSDRIEMKVIFTNLMIAVYYVQFQNSEFSSSLEWRVLMDETCAWCEKSEEFFSSSVMLIRNSDSMLLKIKVF